MIFLVIYVPVILFFMPSSYAEDEDFCQKVFKYEELDVCNTTDLTSLGPKPESDEGALYIYDATDSNSDFDGDSTIKLHCCFHSYPYCPTITWYKNGVEIRDDDQTIRKIRRGLTIKVFAKPDAGGNYTCTATTPYDDEVMSHTITNVKIIRRCADKFTVLTTPDHKNVIRMERGSRQELVWNFICFGALHTKTVRCSNDSKEITDLDGYYNITRTRSRKINDVALSVNITIPNFARSENITCRTDATNSPSATFNLVVKEDVNVGLRQNDNKSFFKDKGVWIVVGFSLLLSFVAVFLLLWCRKKLARMLPISYHPKEKEVAARYDAFISYSEIDGGSFVRSTLKPMLEDECGYKLSLHYREFVPGRTIVDNIVDSIYDSRRIVTIVTPKFLESEWCKFEVDQGLRKAIEKPNTLVVVMLIEMQKKQLPKSLQSYISNVTFLQWNDRKRDEMRKQMKSALGKPFTENYNDENGEDESGVEIAMEDRNPDSNKLHNKGKECDLSNPHVIWSENTVIDIV